MRLTKIQLLKLIWWALTSQSKVIVCKTYERRGMAVCFAFEKADKMSRKEARQFVVENLREIENLKH